MTPRDQRHGFDDEALSEGSRMFEIRAVDRVLVDKAVSYPNKVPNEVV